MIQSEGEDWRLARNKVVGRYGWWLLAAATGVVALFFAVRGRIGIDGGWSGRTIERFSSFERFVHWLTAGSFIVLALTGLNLMYGRTLFANEPSGDSGAFSALHEAFAAVAYWGKLSHNFMGFAFMTGLVLMLVIWIRDNVPDRYDLGWLLAGGGLFGRRHPPARKFNAGQKILFWLVILGGASLSLSGLSLMFPYQLPLFAKTFAVLDAFGLDLPTALSGIEEMQLSQLWHAAVALVLIAVIVGHIYIGTLGMEGALDAMVEGNVDENWARAHHSVWVDEREDGAPPHSDASQPAE